MTNFLLLVCSLTCVKLSIVLSVFLHLNLFFSATLELPSESSGSSDLTTTEDPGELTTTTHVSTDVTVTPSQTTVAGTTVTDHLISEVTSDGITLSTVIPESKPSVFFS